MSFLNIDTRDEAESESGVRLVSEATGIFFTGSDQLRITSILGGTKVKCCTAPTNQAPS